MPIKGSIQPGHIPVNKYLLLFVGVPLLTATSVSGIEEELNVIELPDRTKASGGNTNPVEMNFSIPAHHSVEIAAVESWFLEGQDPVTPTYKKDGSLQMISGSIVGPTRTFTLNGCFITKRKLPDLEMKDDGNMAQYEFSVSIDQITPAG